MAALGLVVRISARSLWNPGQCVLIRVTRKLDDLEIAA